jgi:RHS repeat-associated protein
VDPDGTSPIPALTRTLDRRQDTLLRSNGWDLMKGVIPDPEHTNTYTYSPDGWLATVTGSDTTFIYGYTPNSADLVATETGTGSMPTVSNSWLPDRGGLDFKENKVGVAVVSKYVYKVNALSQRENVATSGTAFGAVATNVWGYDRLGQVVSADHPTAAKDFGYSYDFMGNRKRSSKNTTNPATATGTNLAVYRSTSVAGGPEGGSNLNQYGRLELYGAAAENNSYDVDGNQLNGRYADPNRTPGTRTWDAENRLITAVVNLGYANTTVSTYDAFHRRVAKRVGQLQQNGSITHTTTLTIYDGWNPVADYTYTTSHALNASYTWGKDLSGSLQGAGGVGGLLAVKQHISSPGTYYPTYDGNGNISEYLSSTGAVVAHYEYGPFGEPLAVATPGSLVNLFSHRFSTKPLDAETGYYYYGYRLYDPQSGRWLGRDPIGEKGGRNLYGMAGNDAVSRVDPLGLQVFEQPPAPDPPAPAKPSDENKKDSGDPNFSISGNVLVDCGKQPRLENGKVQGSDGGGFWAEIKVDVTSGPALSDVKRLPDIKLKGGHQECYEGLIKATVDVTIKLGLIVGDHSFGYNRTKKGIDVAVHWTQCSPCCPD